MITEFCYWFTVRIIAVACLLAFERESMLSSNSAQFMGGFFCTKSPVSHSILSIDKYDLENILIFK